MKRKKIIISLIVFSLLLILQGIERAEAMEQFKLALAQSSPVLGDKEASLNIALRDIKKANQAGAKVVVFPEMFLTGYMVLDGKDTSTVFDLAEGVDGPAIKKLKEWAKKYKIYIVMGMPLKSNVLRGVIYNAAVFVGPEGLIGIHRKVGLPTGPFFNTWFYEGNYCKSGERIDVFKTELGRIGIMICYESWWPEIPRILAIKGADLIICISAGPDVTEKGFDLVLPMRAIENSVYVAYVNLPDVEKGVKFFGGARIIAPSGAPVIEAKRYQEDFVVGDINLKEVEKARALYHNIRDRSVFPEVFKEICNRYPDKP